MDAPVPLPPGYEEVYLASTAAINSDQSNRNQKMSLNKNYPKTVSALFKIAELVVSLIVAICAGSSDRYYFRSSFGFGWTLFTSVTSIIIVFVLYLVYLSNSVRNMPHFWPFLQVSIYTLITLSYLGSAIVCTTNSGEGAVAAAAVFCYFALLIYGADTVLHYLAWKNNDPIISLPTIARGGQQNIHSAHELRDVRY